MLLPTRPLDSQVVGNLPVVHPNLAGHGQGYLVGFNLGWPVSVVLPAVPEFLTHVPLTDMGEFVGDVELEDSVIPPQLDRAKFVSQPLLFLIQFRAAP